jgi:transposase-like protein
MGIDKEALKRLIDEKGIETLADLNSLLKDISKEVIESIYEGEITDHLGYPPNAPHAAQVTGNSRNGYGSKTVHTAYGDVVVHPPRDRDGSFDPKIIKKRQRDLSGIEDKVIGLYAKGMSTRDIQAYLLDIYGYEMSPETVSTITDSVMESAREWQTRGLEPIYSMVYLDGTFIKMRHEGKVRNVSLYIVVGINLQGHKSCLGLYIDTNETAKYWLMVLNELKSRGMEDVLIFICDNLAGISDAIEAVYPHSDIQKCIVHQVRNSLRFVKTTKGGHRSQVAVELKTIYHAATKESAWEALAAFAKKWDGQYAYISKSWQMNWDELMTFFHYPVEIRRMIYTTNPIESFHRVVKKYIKTKSIFPTLDSVLKMYFLVVRETEAHTWKFGVDHWELVYHQLLILYEDRLKPYVARQETLHT